MNNDKEPLLAEPYNTDRNAMDRLRINSRVLKSGSVKRQKGYSSSEPVAIYKAKKTPVIYTLPVEDEQRAGKLIVNEVTSKVHHLLLASWYKQPDRADNFKIQLAFKEIADALGYDRNQKTALRKQLRTITIVLATASFFINTKEEGVHIINLFTEADYSRGKLTFWLNPRYAEKLLSDQTATEYFPVSWLRLKGTAYYLALQVIHNANINARWHVDRVSKLNLATTLAKIPTLTLPKNGALYQKVLAPLTKAIEEVQAVTGIVIKPSRPFQGLTNKELGAVALTVVDWGQVDIDQIIRDKRKRLRKNNVRED